MTFYRTKDECPYCGATLTEEKELEVVDNVELEKIKEERLRKAHLIMNNNLAAKVADKKPKDLTSYEEIKAYARFHGYKNGWIFYQAKNRGWLK